MTFSLSSTHHFTSAFNLNHDKKNTLLELYLLSFSLLYYSLFFSSFSVLRSNRSMFGLEVRVDGEEDPKSRMR